jgi:ABC-type uncharacterized transport system fused permease/ATPase subunit
VGAPVAARRCCSAVVSFNCVVVRRPAIVFLDEATSALDVEMETRCMELLHAAGITAVSAGHRESLVPLHATVVDVGVWQ